MKRKIILILLLPAASIISYFTTRGAGAYQSLQPGVSIIMPTPNPTQIAPELRLYTVPQSSSVLEANLPVRGVAGDLWADVIIGQPSFGQITPNQVVANKVFNPGGVLVDRSVVPNQIYVYDAGNSRILGFSSLGVCDAGTKTGMACTSNSDCPGSACTINPTKPADIILGQASDGESMCNGDSGYQQYPALPAPSADTLCGLRPASISILEGGSMATMAVDNQGNLYHPDYFNNRVLRYNNPFTTNAAADFVWGQADFSHGDCNRGRGYSAPDSQSLCLTAPLGSGAIKSGVAVDSSGNLWITDTQNNRVLRFPYNPVLGAPGPIADLVLGQPDFTTTQEGTGLNQMIRPGSARVDPNGNVFVLDGVDGWHTHGRLLVFSPPLSKGMAASQVFTGMGEPTGLELDSSGDLWINNSDKNEVLRLSGGQIVQAVPWIDDGAWGGIGIDRDKNVMTGGWSSQEIRVYSPPLYPYWSSAFLQADYYGAYNELGPQGLANAQGMEVTDTQLIVSDGVRLLFWNNPEQLISDYPPAQGVIGQPNFFTRPRWDPVFGRMRADTHGKLWVVKGNVGLETHILAYQLPLVSQAEPVIEIASPLPLKGGGNFSWTGALHLGGIAYQPECDCLWLSDTENSRVFRVNQISSANRVVDIILGQSSAAGIHCNQGRDSDNGYIHPQLPSRDSLCHPGGLTFDQRGNLFVSDHNLEIAGNLRLLEYDAAVLPPNPSTALFAVAASRVYGRNGSFTEPNCQTGDPMCGPWEPVFDPNNEMVIGFNTYWGPAFPQVYHDPLANTLPYTSLKDFYSHAYSARRDPLNNLYVLDGARSRVLIYKAILRTILGNAGVAGTTLSYTAGTPKNTVSAVNGAYSFNVSDHWNGTVTPSHTCFTFYPTSRSYSDITINQTSQNYAPTLIPGSGCANINILIAGANQGSFGIPPHGSTRASFADVNNGPVKIASTNVVSVTGAERVIYNVNGLPTSFSEMMALPNGQLDNTYWLPWYNNVDLDTQLRFGNVSNTPATVHVWIGGQEKTSGCLPSNIPYPYVLVAGASLRVSCPGVNNGPVQIISNQNIVAAERVIYNVNGAPTSFSEMMALPNRQLDKTYWLPWYNNVDLDTQLRFGNVSNTPATVHVWIGTQEMTTGCNPSNVPYPYVLAVGASLRVSCPGVNNGPVQIISNGNIVAAERVIYNVNGLPTSFTEMMALPNNQLNKIYWLPWYNNVDLDTQLRFGNVGNVPATVHVYIGQQEMTSGCTPSNVPYPYVLGPGASLRISCPAINNGPIKIVSDQNIVAAERVIYNVNNLPTSFSEMMALPNSQLDSTYWLPWYNNIDLDTQLRFGVP